MISKPFGLQSNILTLLPHFPNPTIWNSDFQSLPVVLQIITDHCIDLNNQDGFFPVFIFFSDFVANVPEFGVYGTRLLGQNI